MAQQMHQRGAGVMTLKYIPPKDIQAVNRNIQALEYQLNRDINDKDREIHKEALKVLKERKEQLEVGD